MPYKGRALLPLEVTIASRDPVLPNPPTVADADVPAPTKMPSAIVAWMNAKLEKILREPQLAERVGGQGLNIVASSPEGFGRFIGDQAAK